MEFQPLLTIGARNPLFDMLVSYYMTVVRMSLVT